jgi:transposase
MSQKPLPARFVGLDVHKHYLIAAAVDADNTIVLFPRRVQFAHLDDWMRKTLSPHDAVVLEMTTNAFQLYDDLTPHAGSVTLVHPPHVALITRAQVMTDQIAALTLARLHAAGLLPAVWVPPAQVRDLRALLAQRAKTVRLSTQAKNRLHAVLHRYHLQPVEGDLFAPVRRDWWLSLPVSALQRVRICNDLDTLSFATAQIAALERALTDLAAQDPRVPLLVQLPGIRIVTALTLLAAIGDVDRFSAPSKLVGYAGLGARIHDSGLSHRSGRITKAGRRDIRTVMVEAAHSAANTHPHWQAQLQRLEPRLGRNKAIVAIARKLLVAVWHVLTNGCADRFAEPQRLARKLAQFAYASGKANRAAGQTVAGFVREQLDRLAVGADLDAIQWGRRLIPLPPSRLAAHN